MNLYHADSDPAGLGWGLRLSISKQPPKQCQPLWPGSHLGGKLEGCGKEQDARIGNPKGGWICSSVAEGLPNVPETQDSITSNRKNKYKRNPRGGEAVTNRAQGKTE